MQLSELLKLLADLLSTNQVDVCFELLLTLSREKVLSCGDTIVQGDVAKLASEDSDLSCKAKQSLQGLLLNHVTNPKLDLDFDDKSVNVPREAGGAAAESEPQALAASQPQRESGSHELSEAWLNAPVATPRPQASGSSLNGLRGTLCLPDGTSLAQRLFVLFDQPWKSLVGRGIFCIIVIAIVASTIAFVMESMPQYRHVPSKCAELRALGQKLTVEACEPVPNDGFAGLEWFCALLFTVDLIVRISTVHSCERERFPKGLTRTLNYALSLMNIIDFMSILPFYVELFGGGSNSQTMRVIRLFRILRLFKIIKQYKATRLTLKVFRLSGEPMLILIVFLCIVTVFFASLMYHAEGQRFSVEPQFRSPGCPGMFVRKNQAMKEDEVSPFQSIPRAIWWVSVTMTTVGYGDWSPTTVLGKIIAIASFYAGVIFIALPMTVLSSNFQLVVEQEKKAKKAKAAKQKSYSLEQGHPLQSQGKKPKEASILPDLAGSRTSPPPSPASKAGPFRLLPKWLGLRRTLFIVLVDESSCFIAKVYSLVMMLTILVSTLCIIFESMPEYNFTPAACDFANPTVEDCKPQPFPIFNVLEIAGVSFFTFDYLLRACTVHAALAVDLDYDPGNRVNPVHLTALYLVRPMCLVDALAILPFYIELVIGKGGSLGAIRVLRLIRIFRLLRTRKLRKGAAMITNVIMDSFLGVLAIFVATLFSCIIFASCVFFAENGTYSVDPEYLVDYPDGVYLRPATDGYSMEPSSFSSILYCFWWFFVTACTVGYGDDYPTSALGRSIAVLVFFGGIIMLAFIMTVVGNNFVAHYANFVKDLCKTDEAFRLSVSEEATAEDCQGFADAVIAASPVAEALADEPAP